MSDSAVRFTGVWKRFAPPGAARTLKGWVLGALRPETRPEPFWALRDVDFAILPGETTALVGRNGSGKSTALKLAAGLMRPTRGAVKVAGRVGALLELGAGFHPEFSGRENVYLNASLLGIRRAEIDRSFAAIADFADIGAFMDAPLRTYSSGMVMRLAFAVAVNIDPDILLIDEVLAVGDAAFQRRCFERIRAFQAMGKTIVLVTHDAAAVRMLASRAIWLDGGAVMADGPPSLVLDRYTRLAPATPATGEVAAIGRLELAGTSRSETGAWWAGQPFTATFDLCHVGDPTGLVLTFKVFKSDGMTCYACQEPLPPDTPARSRVTVAIPRLELLSGDYTLEVAVTAGPLYLAVGQLPFAMAAHETGDGIAPLYARWAIAAADVLA